MPMDRFCIHEAPAAAWGANAEPEADAPAARPPILASARVVCRSILGRSRARARVRSAALLQVIDILFRGEFSKTRRPTGAHAPAKSTCQQQQLLPKFIFTWGALTTCSPRSPPPQ